MSFKVNFKPGFIWGTASSAYQIEGAFNTDNKGPSIWDDFCHNTDKVMYGHTGDFGCEHYERYLDDIELMSRFNIKAYRFSISWARIFPNGDDQLNEKGLRFYENLVNALIDHNITPYITLYHWDLPLALQQKGGWQNRDTAVAFSKYAALICKNFSHRVTNFTTLNEPQIISYLGYYSGLHAPGLNLSMKDTLEVIHNLALAHGMAVKAMRKVSKQEIQIGFSTTGNLFYPYKPEVFPANIKAARDMSFAVNKDNWFFCHPLFCDAVCFGKYPEIEGLYEEDLFSFIQPGDMQIIKQPLDFMGVNIYNGHCIDAKNSIEKFPGFPRTAMKWPVTPEVMNYGTSFLYQRYGLPIYITENGLSCNDKIYRDGKVHDLDRIDFLQRYLLELEKSYKRGTDIRGYFHWSFTDNFEWHNGYEERFGLIYIDYRNQKRIPKDSAYWYSSIIT